MFSKILSNYSSSNTKNEVLAGIVVSVALIPEVIAFSFVAGVSPIVGLYTAFILGLITAIFGGKPGMVSGAAGSVAVVVVSLVATHGVEYLFLAAILAGIIQILVGVFRLAKFIRLVPMPVVYGFVNGLALVIAFSQLKMIDGNMVTYFLIALTMAIMYFMPKFTTKIPAGLGAIIVVTAAYLIFNLDTKTIGDLSSISGALPSFHLPDVPWSMETLKIILPYAVIMALVGLIESLLTMEVLEEMSKQRGYGNKEAIALGAGNSVSGMFGGMAGCAMIGQTIINHTSGGRGRISSATAAILIILFVVFLAKYIEQVPLAVLVGIMFMVSIATFEWASFDKLKRIPKEDAFVLVVVTIITFFADLAVAVIAGVIISALVFAWKHARVYYKTKMEGDKKIYLFEGPLFFGSSRSFVESFDVDNDPDEVVMDFKEVRVMDSSGVEAIDKITKKYKEAGKKLTIRHLSKDCKRLLKEAGPYCTYEEDDPDYKVVSDI